MNKDINQRNKKIKNYENILCKSTATNFKTRWKLMISFHNRNG